MVVVIDDDPQVLELMERFLTKEGFTVSTASNGKDGVELARRLQPIAITTDVMMPGLNGHELAEQAKQLRPDLKILLTSGYVSPTVTINEGPESDFPLLPKPYSHRELAQALRDILDHPR